MDDLKKTILDYVTHEYLEEDDDEITTDTELQRFDGNRESIRMQTVIHGLKGVRGRLPT
mgnify:CR=1 FL=1